MSSEWRTIYLKNLCRALFAVHLGVLGGDDLPPAIPLEPSIRPNQASRFVGSVLRLSDSTFAPVHHGEVVTEETDLRVDQPAIPAVLGQMRGLRYFLRFRVAFPIRRGVLKVVGEDLFSNLVVSALGLRPLPLRINHELRGSVVFCRPLSLLRIRGDN